jgi:hypothetical protein
MLVIASTVSLDFVSRGTHDQSRQTENMFHDGRSRATAFYFS